MPPPTGGLPVVLGSNLSGVLVSLSLSRAGVDHVLVGDDVEPPEIPRLGESVNDTASPELWRLYGRELGDCFHYKNHIAYFDGNFATLIHLASPRRRRERVEKFAPASGTPRYPWFGEGLFHLDRIAFDRAIWRKWKAEPRCRFVAARVSRLEHDAATDRVTRIELSDGTSLDEPRYVYDATGWNSVVAAAAKVGRTTLGAPQRVVFTHYRRESAQPDPPEWWRHGTNLLRFDRAFDGFDGIAWVIPIGRTLSVGVSIDADSELAAADSATVMARLELACRRRGLEYREHYPEELPIQELRHSYFVRDRAWGPNWLLAGGSFITIWFPSSSGLWSTTAAAGMATHLLERPALGAFYERSMRGLLPFHGLLDRVIHGPAWRSSWDVYRFFSTGMTLITGRVAAYLRIKNKDYGWFRPANFILGFLSLLGRLLPWTFLLIGGFALVHCRLETDRRQQARAFPLYFHSIPFRIANFLRSVPQILWSAIPRRALPPPREGGRLDLPRGPGETLAG